MSFHGRKDCSVYAVFGLWLYSCQLSVDGAFLNFCHAAKRVLEIFNVTLKPSNCLSFMALFISRNLADMKTINRYFLFIIVNMSFLMASAQGRLMTIAEVDSIVAQRNLQLEVSRLEMDAAEGQLVQARKRENPEVQLMHNVQNPMNRRWFDMGYDGQTEVKLSQPIAIGGQYKNKVRQARATLNATKVAHEAEVQNVRHEARVAFIDLYYTQQKLKVYDKEMASVVEKISTACGEQAEKGNVSKMEAFRVAAMLSQLRAERAELQVGAEELQSQLRLLLNLQDSEPIVALLDEDGAMDMVRSSFARLQPMVLSSDPALLQSVVQSHPEMFGEGTVRTGDHRTAAACQRVAVFAAHSLSRHHATA